MYIVNEFIFSCAPADSPLMTIEAVSPATPGCFLSRSTVSPFGILVGTPIAGALIGPDAPPGSLTRTRTAAGPDASITLGFITAFGPAANDQSVLCASCFPLVLAPAVVFSLSRRSSSSGVRPAAPTAADRQRRSHPFRARSPRSSTAPTSDAKLVGVRGEFRERVEGFDGAGFVDDRQDVYSSPVFA